VTKNVGIAGVGTVEEIQPDKQVRLFTVIAVTGIFVE